MGRSSIRATRSPVATDLVLLGIGAVLLACAWFLSPLLVSRGLRVLSWALYGAAWLVAGGNVLLAAARNIGRGRIFDENFLMTIATLGAFAIGQLPEAAAVMLFFKLGEVLQGVSVRRSRASIRELLDLRPDTARVSGADGVREMAPEEVEVGELVLVRPGERVPLDGMVADGEGFVDTSPLTGEPVPRRVGPRTEVLAGYLSRDASLAIRVTRRAGESSAARIAELVESAVKSKATTELFIRRFARVYTPLVVAGAALVAFLPPLFVAGASLHDWVYRALTMLVISCPCALVVSIPLGYFGGVGGASRHGILVKGAVHLDTLARVRTVVFDKTGTLTEGTFKVLDVAARNGTTPAHLLRLAARAEAHSNHPIAVTLRATQAGNGDESVTDYQEIRGQGVRARVDGRSVLAGSDLLMHDNGIVHDTCSVDQTTVQVAVDGVWQGYIVLGDAPRPDAAAAVAQLKSLGVRHTVLLTGDDTEVARRVAATLGIDEYHGALLPEDKVRHLEAVMAAAPGGATAFAGDGINDAPVLARADVGLAMGASASDAAVETADVVLMAGSPSAVAAAIVQGRRTRAIVWQNVVIALGVKGVFLALGAFGVVTMWEAVIADMGVALAAILNATRALR